MLQRGKANPSCASLNPPLSLLLVLLGIRSPKGGGRAGEEGARLGQTKRLNFYFSLPRTEAGAEAGLECGSRFLFLNELGGGGCAELFLGMTALPTFYLG